MIKEFKRLDDLEWFAQVAPYRPKNNYYLDSKRGREVEKLMFEINRDDFNWHRDDPDTFWIDAQLMVKYKLTDEEIRFVLRQQPGIDNYAKHSKERNAYAEMMRGLHKLIAIEEEKQKAHADDIKKFNL